jgi:hypothetical protein
VESFFYTSLASYLWKILKYQIWVEYISSRKNCFAESDQTSQNFLDAWIFNLKRTQFKDRSYFYVSYFKLIHEITYSKIMRCSTQNYRDSKWRFRFRDPMLLNFLFHLWTFHYFWFKFDRLTHQEFTEERLLFLNFTHSIPFRIETPAFPSTSDWK